jgi:hypothetical protein
MGKGITDLLQSKIATPLDKNKEMELQAQLETMLTQTFAQSDQAQASIELEDSKSTSFYRWGIRPTVMWICALGLLLTITPPIVLWFTTVFSGIFPAPLVLPVFNDPGLRILLAGLLGVHNVTRTVEKVKGII